MRMRGEFEDKVIEPDHLWTLGATSRVAAIDPISRLLSHIRLSREI